MMTVTTGAMRVGWAIRSVGLAGASGEIGSGGGAGSSASSSAGRVTGYASRIKTH